MEPTLERFQSILLVIRGKGKIGYLNETISKPSADSANYGVWEAENSIVMTWLVNSIEPKIGRTFLFYKIAQEIWEVVQEIYSDMENTAQSFQMCLPIRTRQGNSSITEIIMP